MHSENLGRLFARYTIPTVLAMLVGSVYQIADGIFVGHYIGTEGLAAITLVWPWISIPLGFGLMVGVGIGTVSSISRGAGKLIQAKRCIGQLFIWLIAPGVLMGAILYPLSPLLVQWQGASGLSAQYSIEYLRIIAVSCPLLIGSIATPFLMRNLNAPRLATLCMVIGAAVNIMLDYLFIVLWQWEIVGAAVATIIAETLAGVLALCYILSKHSPLRLHLSDLKPNLKLNKKIAVNGAPSLFMYAYFGVAALLHQVMLLKYGNTEWVAAYAIVGYILTVYYLIAEGIANGMQPIVSHMYGAKQIDTVKRTLNMALWWSVGFGVVLTILLQIFPHWFVSIFAGDIPSLADKASYALRVNLFSLFLDGLFVVAAAFLQALNQGKQALYITLGNMLFQVPFLLILPRFFDIDGVWLAMPISNIILMVIVVVILYKKVTQLGQKAATT